jgi:hypothetical protein
MSDMIARLAEEFSKEKNVTQREIMEAALIEFLQKYGFKREINSLLKNWENLLLQKFDFMI